MSVKKVFVVEDESHIQQLIKYNLESAGYHVEIYESGEFLFEHCGTEVPDMFVLDIMLPGMDGLEICRRLRTDLKTKYIPIILLTAKSEEFDKVLGLELGADDYITKPFSVRELTARIKALFRRTEAPPAQSAEDENVIVVDDIRIYTDKHEVEKAGDIMALPLKEFELLKLLVQNRGKVLTREILLEKIWGFDYYGETRTVDVHIRYLRQKIEDDDKNPKYIHTVRGVGYKFAK